MPRLSGEDRNKIIAELRAGTRVTAIAATYKVHRRTIYSLLKRVESTGSYEDRPRTGRPRVINFQTSHHIVQQIVANEDLSARETARRTIGRHGKSISPRTVKRRLKEHNVFDRCTRRFSKKTVSVQLAETTQAIPTVVSTDGVFLTPYLKDGQKFAAQDASYVSIPYLESERDLDSWSGYISVGPNSSYHLFFWFFCCTRLNPDPAGQRNITDNSSAPLLIWLNGGPGYSSMLGLFEEIGPLKALHNGSVTQRDVAWTNHFDVIFIDDLMGTGFSYSDTGQKTRSVKEAAGHLYEFIDQFYQLFPDTKTKDLYIGGQSYGGKYAPELAGLVKKDKSMNLKGLFVASGLMNPAQMLPLTPDTLVTMGMLNDIEGMKMRDSLTRSLDRYKENPKKEVIEIVTIIFDKLATLMGHNSVDNILYSKGYNWTLDAYLNLPEVQKAIHVKPTQYATSSDTAILEMAEDFPDGVQDVLKTILDSGIKVLIYNGQLDPLVSVPMTEEFLSSLEWSGNDEYVDGKNKVAWKDEDGTVAGYVTKVENLTRVVIRNAGHRTAIDQPRVVLDMMRRFVLDLPFVEQDLLDSSNNDQGDQR